MLYCCLYEIYNRFISPEVARTRLAHWFNQIEQSGFNAFATVRRTFEAHHDTIINYFNGRSTNAAAESFNAKIKDFRRQFRGDRCEVLSLSFVRIWF